MNKSLKMMLQGFGCVVGGIAGLLVLMQFGVHPLLAITLVMFAIVAMSTVIGLRALARGESND